MVRCVVSGNDGEHRRALTDLDQASVAEHVSRLQDVTESIGSLNEHQYPACRRPNDTGELGRHDRGSNGAFNGFGQFERIAPSPSLVAGHGPTTES